MCAINPAHKKRFIIDVYTSDKRIKSKQFEQEVIECMLTEEERLNSTTKFRWHVKETKQKAD